MINLIDNFKKAKIWTAMFAIDEKKAIGSANDLLCHLPADLKHFKKQTLDQTVLLGPNTLYSLPNSLPLPLESTLYSLVNRLNMRKN